MIESLSMKRATVIVFVCLSFCACGYQNLEYFNPDNVAKLEFAVKSDTLHYDSVFELYSNVDVLNCIDDYLILTNSNKDTLFTVIDMMTDSVVAKFGSIGHARNEFLTNPFIIYCIRNMGHSPLVYVLDQKSTKVIDLRKSISENKCVLSDVIKEDKDVFFFQPYHVSNTQSFVYKTVSYIDPRDGIYFPPEFYVTGKESFKWNIYPNIIKPEYSNAVDIVYYNIIKPKPDGSKVLSVSLFMDIVMLFDLNTKLATGYVNPDSYTFNYVNENSDEASVRNTIRLYHGATCVTDSHFAIVEDGKLYIDHYREKSETGYSTINIYTWDGKLERSCVVDKNVREIAYHEKTKTLYAISFDNRLFKYKL